MPISSFSEVFEPAASFWSRTLYSRRLDPQVTNWFGEVYHMYICCTNRRRVANLVHFDVVFYVVIPKIIIKQKYVENLINVQKPASATNTVLLKGH